MSFSAFQMCDHCSLAPAPGDNFGTLRFDTPLRWNEMCRLLALRLKYTSNIAGRFARTIYPRFRIGSLFNQ